MPGMRAGMMMFAGLVPSEVLSTFVPDCEEMDAKPPDRKIH